MASDLLLSSAAMQTWLVSYVAELLSTFIQSGTRPHQVSFNIFTFAQKHFVDQRHYLMPGVLAKSAMSRDGGLSDMIGDIVAAFDRYPPAAAFEKALQLWHVAPDIDQATFCRAEGTGGYGTVPGINSDAKQKTMFSLVPGRM